MATPEETEALMRALEPFTADARRNGFEDGRSQGILSVYNGIIRWSIRADDGKELPHDEMGDRIKATEPIRIWMERHYPIIKQTYPDQPAT
jgi:hypothetical protein